jgi:hypothetical protein
MSFVFDVLSNVVANAVFWAALGVAFWSLSKAGQTRFSRFFGVDQSSLIVIALSNVWKREASSRRIGFSISMHESLAAQSINSLLATAPMRMPELVRGLVDSLWLRTRIQCKVQVSPPEDGDVESGASLIVIGAAGRNSVRRKHLADGIPRALLAAEEPGRGQVRPREVKEVLIRRRGGDLQRIQSELVVALIEKVVLPEQGKTFFYCLGSRGDCTWLVTEYLVRHWRRLHREFGTGSFVVCLGIALSEQYITQYSDPLVLASMRV